MVSINFYNFKFVLVTQRSVQNVCNRTNYGRLKYWVTKVTRGPEMVKDIDFQFFRSNQIIQSNHNNIGSRVLNYFSY